MPPPEEPPHVLIIDDDTRIRELLGDYLRRHGLRVSTAASAAEARARMQALAFDALVLDVMMPGEDGLSLARSLRQQQVQMPILMLSALGETPDRIAGLSAGSDDYMAKPFEPEELLLRLKAMLRRHAAAISASGEQATTLQLGPYVLDARTGELRDAHGRLLPLTVREREILRLLAQRPGEPLSREELRAPTAATPRAVDVEITRLRRKLEADPANPRLIRTVRGKGYLLATTTPVGNGPARNLLNQHAEGASSPTASQE